MHRPHTRTSAYVPHTHTHTHTSKWRRPLPRCGGSSRRKWCLVCRDTFSIQAQCFAQPLRVHARMPASEYARTRRHRVVVHQHKSLLAHACRNVKNTQAGKIKAPFGLIPTHVTPCTCMQKRKKHAGKTHAGRGVCVCVYVCMYVCRGGDGLTTTHVSLTTHVTLCAHTCMHDACGKVQKHAGRRNKKARMNTPSPKGACGAAPNAKEGRPRKK